MAVVKNLMVRAGADFSAITKQANKAKTSMSGMQASVSKSCSRMTVAITGMNKVFATLGATISVAAVVAAGKAAKTAFDEQTEASAKLAQVMRNTMGARSDEVKSIEDLIDAQERLGVVKGDVQTEAAQELATYLTLSDSLKTLIPVMNDMVAQQYGIGASAESAVSIATMMGKVMNGQTSALSRYGYSFTAAQEAVLKYGNEAERAATLAAVVEESVGGMNAALAATPNGRLQQVSNTLGKIQESFGQAVSNIAVLFIPALNAACNVLASLATLANKVAQALANVFGRGASGASTAVTYTAAATGAMSDLTDETEAAGAAAKNLSTFGFDTLQKLSGTAGSSGTAEADTPAAAGGGISETTTGADEVGESIGWLEAGLARLKSTMAGLNFDPLNAALSKLKDAAAPLTQGLFSGLSWAYTNIFEPLAKWTVEDVLPAFLRLLAAAASVLSAALAALQPLASWLWTNFLQPIAAWTGGAIVAVLDGLTAALQGISGWISQNQGLVQGMTVTVGAFFAAWQLTSLAEFIVNAGGLAGVIAKVTGALKACTVAKIADKLETAAICALYVKDWAVAMAGNVVALGKQAAAFASSTAATIAAKLGIEGMTVAQAAHTIAANAGTAATTALGVAMNVLCSPITLVIAAIAALVAGIVLLVKNWDTVKAAGAAAWTGIQTAWSVASSWFTTNIAEPIKATWNTAMTNLKQWGSDTWTSIKSVWSVASSWFTTNVTTPISNGFKNFANGIIGFFEGLVNGAINGINSIIGAFNRISFSIPDWVPVIGGNSWGFSLATFPNVTLPRLANGAVFEGNNPYLAIVNDQKHGVNVESPLSTIVEAMMIALRSTNFGDNIEVNVKAVFEGQLAALARLLRPYFEADAKRVGNQASTAKGVV